MAIRHIKTPSELTSLLNDKKDTLTVIDFFAVWCGPCHAIAPTLEKLAKSYPHVAFVKVDVDQSQEIAKEYAVSAMPTFKFIVNKEVVETMRGANPSGLEANVKKYAPAANSFPTSAGQATGSAALSLLEYVDRPQLNCLNESTEHTIKSILQSSAPNATNEYLASDTDEQLLINIPFNQTVRIKEISIKSLSKANAPKRIKLQVNKPNLGFEDTSADAQFPQILELTEEQVLTGARIELRFVRFQAVNVLTIFVENNHGNEEETHINAIDLFGWPGQTSRVEQLHA